MVALFEDKDSYFVNADDSEHGKWFERFMEHLEEEPRWHDGEVLQA